MRLDLASFPPTRDEVQRIRLGWGLGDFPRRADRSD